MAADNLSAAINDCVDSIWTESQAYKPPMKLSVVI